MISLFMVFVGLSASLEVKTTSFIRYPIPDNLVLTEIAAVTTSTGEIGTLTLSYVFLASSAGDQIAVRFVRADDLNPDRIAAVDYLKVNGQFISMQQPTAVPIAFDTSDGGILATIGKPSNEN